MRQPRLSVTSAHFLRSKGPGHSRKGGAHRLWGLHQAQWTQLTWENKPYNLCSANAQKGTAH